MPELNDDQVATKTNGQSPDSFREQFKSLTGHPPFQWQTRLFKDWLAQGRLPSACGLPTGLGKTSIMALWLIARAAGAELPRRLAYVVDRRAVVDQATTFAETLRDSAPAALGLRDLPVSTLRGQHIDNRRWLENPAAPAIIVGTVDMIGSRLLFSGYGVSRSMRPYHAGLLGADTLVLLDEAHLCPPFEAMLQALASDRRLKASDAGTQPIIPAFRVLPLSATSRENAGETFMLEAADIAPEQDPEAHKRVTAGKRLAMHDLPANQNLADQLAEAAVLRATESGPARVVIYCSSRDTAIKVKKNLDKRFKKEQSETELLIGARRVHERERLQEWLATNGLIGDAVAAPEAPTFLVATSAGEVGIDLDAEHMVCELVEWERMVQRLGRVNRRGGHRNTALIDVYIPAVKGDTVRARLQACRAALERLPSDEQSGRDASPRAIQAVKDAAASDGELRESLEQATSPPPLHPALTRPLIEAWSLTSLNKHTGRPDVEPWLRGWTNDEPQVTIAWRSCLPWRDRAAAPIAAEAEHYLDLAPIHLEETLEAATWLAFETLTKRAQAANKAARAERDQAESPLEAQPGLIVYARDGAFQQSFSVAQLADLGSLKGNQKKEQLDQLHGRTLMVAASLGGLDDNGMLDATATPATALDNGWSEDDKARVGYQLLTSGTTEPPAAGWKQIGSIPLAHPEATEVEATRAIHVLVIRRGNAARSGEPAVASQMQRLEEHHEWAAQTAHELAHELALPDECAAMLVAAAAHHDSGKRRLLWQLAMNAPAGGPYAKTAGGGNGRRLNGYRHEFGSLRDVQSSGSLDHLDPNMRELALHLIAAHHGNAHPTLNHFDPEAPLADRETLAHEVMERFARLQKAWGPWGLAWWESLLRAADQRASRQLDEEADS